MSEAVSSAAVNSPADAGELPPAAQAFAQGLNAALVPAVLQCDEQMRAVLHSQETLSLLIDKLATALETFQAQKDRPQLSEYAHKLLRARRRLKGLQQTVALINNRIHNIRNLIRRKETQAATRRPAGAAPGKPSQSAVATAEEKTSAAEDGPEQPSSASAATETAEAADESETADEDDGSPAQSTAALLEGYNPLSVAELLKLVDWD